MGREAMAALLSSVALIARRRRDVRGMQPAWSRSYRTSLSSCFHTEDENNPNWDAYTESQIAVLECMHVIVILMRMCYPHEARGRD